MGDEDRSDELKTEERIRTTIIFEFSHHHGGISSGISVGGGGIGIDVGTPVDPGGVVSAVTPTTVTVEFPGGVPKGPVRLPGSETTVVKEAGSTGSTDPVAAGGSPWGGENDLEVAGGLGSSASDVVQLADTLHRRYRLPCPGSRGRSIRLVETTSEGEVPTRQVFNVANTGSCNCTIFIASFNGFSHLLNMVKIPPGQVLPLFRAPPEAAIVAVACAGDCPSEGCFGEVTTAVPVG